VKPDKPGTAEGVTPVFYNLPNPTVPREGFPLTGVKPWKALMQAIDPQVPAAQNKAFEQFATSIGTSFNVIYGTYVNYLEKFQVTMASDDVPDMCMIVSVAQLPGLLNKYFTDLTDVLGGDNVKKYPGLANIPTPAWKSAEVNGRLWGIPQPRPPAGSALTARGDILAKRGVSDPNPKLSNGDDFMELLKQLTNKDKNEFAMGADPNGWLLPMMLTMFGAPNIWKVEGGKFINQLETEEYKEALNQAGKIIQAGYLHPNSFSDPASNSAWYTGGITALYYQSFIGWGGNARSYPEWNVGNVELPKWDGGGMAPIRKSVAAYGSYVAIKKSDADRVDQLLRVCDYIASPFGTKQYMEVSYGVEGYNYSINDQGNPVSKAGTDNPGIVPMSYAGGNSGAILFGQGVKESVDAQYDYLSRALPAGIDNPTIGLYSETYTSKGATLAKEQLDVQRSIMLGEKPMSAFDDFVKTWKSRVGDKSSEEYAEAAAQQ